MPVALARPASGWPLTRAAAAIGVTLDDKARLGLETWLDLLATWNARVDLTAARSPDELVDLMVADALVLSTRIAAGTRVIDVGTGAGAPGLPLAIVRPDLDIVLVEPLAKRTAFLRTVLGTLFLPRAVVDGRKGDTVADARPGGWDVALARATLAPPAWLTLASRLLATGGSAWVFLAREANPVDATFDKMDEVCYKWPLTGAARRLVRYELAGGRRQG